MEPPSSLSVFVINESGLDIPVSPIEHAVSASLKTQGIMVGDVSVLLTQDSDIQDLNARYRGIDEPTDVLTFINTDSSAFPGTPLLGDIAIAVPYAQRQAELRGVPLNQELAYLAIHGALHLTGFDDQNESDRAAMVAEMNRVALQIGIPGDEAWASLLHESTDAVRPTQPANVGATV